MIGAWVALAFILPMIPALPDVPGVTLSRFAAHALLSLAVGGFAFSQVK
jgi:hypothetical protein